MLSVNYLRKQLARPHSFSSGETFRINFTVALAHQRSLKDRMLKTDRFCFSGMSAFTEQEEKREEDGRRDTALRPRGGRWLCNGL